MSRPPTKGWEHEQSCKRKAAKNRGLVWRSNCCPNQFLYPLLLLSVRYHRRHETEKWICLQFWIGICVNICHFPVHQGSARFLVFNFSCKILTSFLYIFCSTLHTTALLVLLICSTILFHFFISDIGLLPQMLLHFLFVPHICYLCATQFEFNVRDNNHYHDMKC